LAIAGTQCLPAAAFLAIKDCLARVGADVSNLAPSTQLAEFARRYPATFVCDVARLAPGAMPDVELDAPEDVAGLSLGCASAAFWIVGLIGKLCESHLAYVMLIGAFLQLLHWIGAKSGRESRIRSVTFGELRTFRDLAKCIAARAA
jgi:hypothetical protein